MSRLKFLFAAAVMTAAVSCVEEQGKDLGMPVPMTFVGHSDESASPSTKTSLNATFNILWDEDDYITVFAGDGKGVTFSDVTVDESGTVATFKGDIPLADIYHALYPAQEDAMYDSETESVTAVLSSVQGAVEGSFGDNVNLSVAKSSSEHLKFLNVGAIVGVQCPSAYSPSSIMLVSRDPEVKMSGKAAISYNDGNPVAVPAEDAASYVEFKGGFNASSYRKIFYFVVYPGEYKSGFDIKIKNAAGTHQYIASAKEPLTLKRNDNFVLFNPAENYGFGWNAPVEPENVTAVLQGLEGVAMTWECKSGSDLNAGYNIYVRPAGTSGDGELNQTISDYKVLSCLVQGMEPGKTYDFGVQAYRFRAYVYDHLTDTYCYSEEKTIALTGEPGSISVTSSPVTSSSLNSAIKVYSFTAKGGAGQTIKGHYAVADCSSSSSVCFKVLNPSSTKLITAQASGATGCQVLVNGTIFGAKHNLGVVVQNGSHTQEWISELCSYYGEVSSDYQAITRAVLGVDASGNPSAYWVSRPSSSATYYYDRPIPAMAETDSYPMADTTFPDTPVSWNPYQALSCGPMLVFDGRVMVSSSYSSTYASYYNNYEIWGWKTNNIYASTRARTAVGYMPDGRIVLLVCDETGGSGGAKLPDVARIMQGLGCESAMNLDGGGSSAMWVKGKAVVNSWSDTDRPVRATCGFFLR